MNRFQFTVRLNGGMNREMTAFRRGPGKPWTIKPEVKGRPQWMSLKVVGESKADLELVRKRARLRLQALVDGEFEPRAAKVKVVRWATIGQLVKAYGAGIALETRIGVPAIKDNVRRLLLIVREAEGLGSQEAALGLSSERLTLELVERFQDGRARAVAGKSELVKGRARRTMDGTLNKARGLFDATALRVYRKAGLQVPELKEFMAAPMRGNWNSADYVPIPDRILQAMDKAAWEELRSAQPPVFLIYLLMLRCGLRNMEVEHARRAWIEHGQAAVMREGKLELESMPFLAIVSRESWRGAKNQKQRRVPIAPDVLEQIEALGGADHLLGGTPFQRSKLTHLTINGFVRRFLPGVEEDPEGGRTKASYELRKHFGALVASTQGLDRAAEYLGDRRDTVERHYHAWLQQRTARPLLASELLPQVLAAVA